MKRFGLLLSLQLIAVMVFGQLSLTGIVKDSRGELLGGANLMLGNNGNRTTANSKGEFRFVNIPAGDYKLTVTFLGYTNYIQELSLGHSTQVEIILEPSTVLTEEVLVSAARAGENSPFAYTNIGKEELQAANQGQDVPFLLSYTPSFVATSDAGNGVGYTNFRIRGSDPTRINVTINGIPMSDAESQSTYFVDIPDMAASTENIQVQRGVGNSTNGSSAFGASIDMQTSKLNREAKTSYSSSVGSFQTFRNNLSASTGLLNGKYAFDVSMSKINSAGFIDRASSDLKSFFVSGGYFTSNTILKATIFSGFEQTYQAWNGIPSVRLNNDIAGMNQYETDWLYTHEQTQNMLNSNSRTYNLYTYKNQVDHYQQDNYQLQFSHKFNPYLNLNASAFFVYGRGYYEEYENDQNFGDYQLSTPVVNDVPIESTDMITRKWLDNNFYGTIFSLSYKKGVHSLTLGGGANRYDGNHFGRIVWAKTAGSATPDYEWYRGTGVKQDFNLYSRYTLQINEVLTGSADLQTRFIKYQIGGLDEKLRDVSQVHNYNFFNPKFGLVYSPNTHREAYLSYSRANREPNRSNFVDADPQGKHPTFETLNDVELGYKYNTSEIMLGTNLYAMHYNNQLVHTGQINSVGAPIMTNVDKSYRQGIEVMGAVSFLKKFKWTMNTTISTNKIEAFTEYVEDWDNGGVKEIKIGKTDLAFSPNLTACSILSYKLCKPFEISFLSNYVGKQFVDNTANNDRMLNPYLVSNLKFDYRCTQNLFKSLDIRLLVNNIFDSKYESNAWVYSYLYNGKRNKMDGYFPQAGTNFIVSISVGF
jgi:iron complex outermembrane recepter protein